MGETLEFPTAEYPPFLIGCSRCGKEPGECCSRWEGAPCACMHRVRAAERKFGRYRHKGGLCLRVTLAERAVGNCLGFLQAALRKASRRMDGVVRAWADR